MAGDPRELWRTPYLAGSLFQNLALCIANQVWLCNAELHFQHRAKQTYQTVSYLLFVRHRSGTPSWCWKLCYTCATSPQSLREVGLKDSVALPFQCTQIVCLAHTCFETAFIFQEDRASGPSLL